MSLNHDNQLINLIFSKILMPIRLKKIVNIFITHKNQDLKKLFCMMEARSLHAETQRRLGLHSGGSLILPSKSREVRVCIAEGRHGVRGSLPRLHRI